jgi:signal peptidase II
LTKWWVFTHYALLPSEQNLRLFPEVITRTAGLPETAEVAPGFFQIVHWANTGAAFSIGTERNLFFVALSLFALGVLVVMERRGAFRDALSRIGAAMLIAGVLGNLTDRLIHRYVVDFLLFDLHVRFADPWPAFNVADSCICVAVGLFLIHSSLESRSRNEAAH